MTVEALSGDRVAVPELHSPHNLAQEELLQTNAGFPQSIDELEYYLRTMPLEQKLDEGRLLQEDLAQSAIDNLYFPWIPLALRKDSVEKDKSTIVIGPGFATLSKMYLGPELYFQNEGHKTVVYSPETFGNLGPLEKMPIHFLNFLDEVAQKSGGLLDLWVHSKLGLLILLISVKYPERLKGLVDHIIYVGAPIPKWVNSSLGEAYLLCLKLFGGDDFELTKLLDKVKNPGQIYGVSTSSIGNPKDGVIQGDFIGAYYPTDGPHTGMPINMDLLKLSIEIIDGPQAKPLAQAA